MARIVSLGAALQDVYLIDQDDFGTNKRGFFNQFELGSKIDIDKIHFSTGGGATNAATTFARYHHDSIFMGCIAKDSAGRAILDTLDRENIDTRFITYTDKVHTGYSVLLLTPTGERTILTCRGASAKFDTLEVSDLRKIKPDWLYITTIRGHFKLLEKFLKTAKSLNTKIMFNPGNLELKEPEKLLNLLKYVDILLVNKSEAKQLVGKYDPKNLIERLHLFCPTVIITDGHNGAYAIHEDKSYQIGLYEDTPAYDATGAGDAFGSGFLAAFADGKSFTAALTFASANSTSVVKYVGTKQGILKRSTRLHEMPIKEI